VFDKANDSNILYSNPKHDISDKVLKKMGLKPGETTDGAGDEDADDAGKEEKDADKGNSKPGVGGKSDLKSPAGGKKRP
jgi:hypothetical protein